MRIARGSSAPAASGDPHPLQYRAVSGFACPHWVHVITGRVYAGASANDRAAAPEMQFAEIGAIVDNRVPATA